MRYEEYIYNASEISQLERLLDKLPEERVVERVGLEHRLSSLKEQMKDIPVPAAPRRVYMTFRGRPVRDDTGIDANFGTTAMGLFTDAVAMAAAGSARDLKSVGAVPGRRNGQPVITGVTTGSFGFELELPTAGQDEAGAGEPTGSIAEAVRMVHELLTISSQGSDSELSQVADDIHPRAARKMGEFLEFMIRSDARFEMAFEGKEFRVQSNRQLEDTANRLTAQNIREETSHIMGVLIGVLPATGRFQLNCLDDGTEIEGKLGPEIEHAYEIAQIYTNAQVNAEIRSVRVGQGRPRYTLLRIER